MTVQEKNSFKNNVISRYTLKNTSSLNVQLFWEIAWEFPIMPSSGNGIATKLACQSPEDPAFLIYRMNSTAVRKRLLSELNVTTPFPSNPPSPLSSKE